MKDLWAMVIKAGLQDGLNPCIFVSCAVFILLGLWLKRNSLPVAGSCAIFGLAYAAGSVAFNFGPGQVLVMPNGFVFAAKILYFILGLCAFAAGILFFRDWFILRRRGLLENEVEAPRKSMGAGSLIAGMAVAMLALGLSALATLWPINTYIMLLGNGALIKGQWHSVMPLVLSYVLISLWPLWMAGVLLNGKNLRPSFLKIICSAIFFTASTGMILMFK